MADLKVGAGAKLRQPVIVGDIIDARYNQDQKQMEFALSYRGPGNEPHLRWFLESELEPA